MSRIFSSIFQTEVEDNWKRDALHWRTQFQNIPSEVDIADISNSIRNYVCSIKVFVIRFDLMSISRICSSFLGWVCHLLRSTGPSVYEKEMNLVQTLLTNKMVGSHVILAMASYNPNIEDLQCLLNAVISLIILNDDNNNYDKIIYRLISNARLWSNCSLLLLLLLLLHHYCIINSVHRYCACLESFENADASVFLGRYIP